MSNVLYVYVVSRTACCTWRMTPCAASCRWSLMPLVAIGWSLIAAICALTCMCATGHWPRLATGAGSAGATAGCRRHGRTMCHVPSNVPCGTACACARATRQHGVWRAMCHVPCATIHHLPCAMCHHPSSSTMDHGPCAMCNVSYVICVLAGAAWRHGGMWHVACAMSIQNLRSASQGRTPIPTKICQRRVAQELTTISCSWADRHSMSV
jgi:hypothetical protein